MRARKHGCCAHEAAQPVRLSRGHNSLISIFVHSPPPAAPPYLAQSTVRPAPPADTVASSFYIAHRPLSAQKIQDRLIQINFEPTYCT